VGLALTALAAGFALAQAHAEAARAPVLERRIGPLTVEGRVVALEPGLKGVRVTLETTRISRLSPERTTKFVRLRLRVDGRDLAIGQSLSLTAILMPPPQPSMPGAYDFARDAWFRQLGAVGFAFGKPRVTGPPPAGPDWRTRLAEVRRGLHARITAALPGAAGAVASALMTGERGTIPPGVVEDMRESGLAHLLAISGLHVGLVTGVVFFGLRGLLALFPAVALRYPIKKWAAVLALIGGGVYTLMTGATVPTQRAFLMTGLVFGAVLVDRAAISMRLVAWAALVVLVIAPQSLTGPSFQMSFAAVIALVAVYERARGLFARSHGAGLGRRVAFYVAGVALTILVAGLATAPFAVFHFNRMASFGLIANLGAVPLTALWVMPWSVMAYLLAPLGLEAWPLTAMGWGLDAVLWIAHAVAALPSAAVLMPEMPVAAMVLIALGGLWLALWKTRLRMAGLALLAAGLIVVVWARPPDLVIAGDGESFAVRDGGGGILFAGDVLPRFERETWLRRAGAEDTGAPRKRAAFPARAAGGHLTCDALACIYRARGQSVSLIRDPLAAAEDCARADVVVALVPLGRGRCRGAARIVGFFGLWREGGHAIWLDPVPKIASVAA
jgi:competence protein ComEC